LKRVEAPRSKRGPGACLFARSMCVAAVSFANHQSDPRKDPAGPVFVFVGHGDTASVGRKSQIFGLWRRGKTGHTTQPFGSSGSIRLTFAPIIEGL
jgi:hypothetical protein